MLLGLSDFKTVFIIIIIYFSGTDAEAVKLSMLDEITTNYDWYESRGMSF